MAGSGRCIGTAPVCRISVLQEGKSEAGKEAMGQEWTGADSGYGSLRDSTDGFERAKPERGMAAEKMYPPVKSRNRNPPLSAELLDRDAAAEVRGKDMQYKTQ